MWLTIGSLWAQAPKAEPATASPTAKAQPFAELQAILEGAVQEGTVVGNSALVFKAGEVVFYGQAGDRDGEKELPIERDTIFRIYSMSKPITSVAAMQLVELGKMAPDDRVHQYLPELDGLTVLRKGKEVPPKRVMTVRDLLRHTSGFTYGFFGNTEVDKAYRKKGLLVTDRDLEHMVSKLAQIPLQNHPGTRFHYSVSTDVLARLVEVVSEKSFDAYLQANIFEPLGMVDTFFVVPAGKQDRFAQLYREVRGDLQPAPKINSYRFMKKTGFRSGGGGLCSTLDDYLRFCQMLLGEGRFGEHQILKAETVETMFTNQLAGVEQSSRRFQFGLGFQIDPKRGDFAWGGAAGTRFWLNPEKQTAILYMVQINPYGKRKTGERIRDWVYANWESAEVSDLSGF